MDAPRYRSTRGEVAGVSFREALLQGLAPDGGLFVPDRIPDVRPAAWQKAERFADVGLNMLAPWLRAEVPASVLHALTDDAFDFPVPLVSLSGDGLADVHVLELFHGPTLSFKDFGARTMARLMAFFLRDEKEPLTILVATSGDTGSAVADGFAGQENIRVVLLYPAGQVSPVQERQLIVRRDGVQALAVQGTFDDCQRLVKGAFADSNLRGLRLSSANSINIGRLLPQMLYYAWAMREGALGDAVFCVPSGNLGNLTGGVLAMQSGLPVRRFIAAHNANRFFPDYLGGFRGDFPPSVRTRSNAMDVGAPSNFERLQTLLPDGALERYVWATSVADEVALEAMQRVYERSGYLADPHTAVGLDAVRRYREATGDTSLAVVLATAHPAKFPDVTSEALGFRPEAP
ncbi:MAG: threonine synthase, partial [Rhodothermales bacterium]